MNSLDMAKHRSKRKQIKESKPLELYFLLISAIIILPFVYSSKVLDNTLAPRLLGLGVIILIFLMVSFFKPANKQTNYNFLKLVIFPVFLLYFLISTFSMMWAINPSEGLFDITKTFLSLALLIFAANVFISNPNSILLLVKAVIISAAIAVVVGLYQYITNVSGNTDSKLFMVLYEIKGLMAHKNQYVVSIYFMLPFTLFGIYKLDNWWRRLSILTSSLIFIIIILLQTRSVWISTLVFLFGFAILWLLFVYKKKIEDSSKILKKGLIITGVVIIGFTGSIILFQKSDAVQLMKYKVLSLFDSNSSDNQGRLNAWGSTLDLVNDNFLLGVGAGNWRIEAIPYSNLNTGSSYQNWQRPHNDFLWVLSEKGIFGVLLYISLFLIIFIYGLKILLRETDRDKKIFAALILSGIAGYLIIANVTFPLERINHQVYLMIMMAFIISMYYKPRVESTPTNKKIVIPVLLLGLGLTLFSMYYSMVRINSEINTQYLISAQKRGRWADMNAYADKAYSKFVTIDPMSNSIYFYTAYANKRMNNNKLAVEYYNIAKTHFPTLSDIYSNLGNLYTNLGNNEKALECYKESLRIYPHDASTLLNLTIFYYSQKKYEEAYLALLDCDPKHSKKDYGNLMQELRFRVNNKTK